MKLATAFLPLTALSFSNAFIIPDDQLTQQITLQSEKESQPQTFYDRLQGSVEKAWSGVEDTLEDAVASSENALDNAINAAIEAGKDAKSTWECHESMTKFDIHGWLQLGHSAPEDIDGFDGHDKKPHHSPHKKPHHPPHHPSNKTVYELIASSKYTTKLAKLINEYPDLVETLNGTAANYTVFAPTDKAFKKLPKGHKKPSKELIKSVLTYHFSSGFYPTKRLLATHTLPSALSEEALGGEPQRLRVAFSLFKGLTVNFYSRIVAVNIFGSNGVIHGVDSLILPPPPAYNIIELFPTQFSTLLLGLEKTGLAKTIAEAPHEGGTLFAPNNDAWKVLGPKINAFLFSKYGEKYLKGLLRYHIVANKTLYSDALYQEKSGEVDMDDGSEGFYHVDLPTLLDGKSLGIDIFRYGGYIRIKINGFSTVSIQDGLAKDGVIHVPSSVLIPPKTPGGRQSAEGELTVDELKDRLDAYVEEL